MPSQWLRNCSLVVADASGNGFDFGNFRVSFAVRRGDIQTPNSLDARIWNLSDATAKKIQGSEYTQLALSVGYIGNPRPTTPPPPQLLFRGTIRQYRAGRLNATDSYVDLTAADSDEAYNFAPIFISVPAGSNQNAVADLLVAALEAHGGAQQITLGYVPTLPENGLIRGKTYYGLARDHLRKFANNNNCKWSIQDGNVCFIPFNSYIPGGEIPVISVSTGLIGVPEQTQAGIRIRTLLNPSIKIGQLIQLNSQINQFRLSLDSLTGPVNNPILESTNAINQQGLYYVMKADHVGDTRGEDWYSDLTCLSVDATTPLNNAQFNNPLAVGPIPNNGFGQSP
jgi:hypothetical protein